MFNWWRLYICNIFLKLRKGNHKTAMSSQCEVYGQNESSCITGKYSETRNVFLVYIPGNQVSLKWLGAILGYLVLSMCKLSIPSLASVLWLPVLGCWRKMAVKHGRLCGGQPVPFVDIKGSLYGNENTKALSFRQLNTNEYRISSITFTFWPKIPLNSTQWTFKWLLVDFFVPECLSTRPCLVHLLPNTNAFSNIPARRPHFISVFNLL